MMPDPKPLTDDQRAMAETWIWLARKIVRGYAARLPSLRDDIYSIAYEALSLSASSYDPSLGTFPKHAAAKIRWAIQDYLRLEVPLGYRHRDDAPSVMAGIPTCGHDDSSLVGHSRPRSPESEIDDADAFEGILRHLPKRHAQFCRMVFADDVSQAEIAKSFGCSQSRVCTIIHESIAMLAENPAVQRMTTA